MSASAKILHGRVPASDGDNEQAGRAVLAIAGALMSLVGAILAVGGYLSAFNGSAFHMFAGFALIVSGVLMARRHRASVAIYLVLFVGTLAWSMREIDAGSSLAFRLVGPVILLAVLAIVMPVLCNWRPRRAATAFVGLTLVTIGLGAAAHSWPGPKTATDTQFQNAETKGVLR